MVLVITYCVRFFPAAGTRRPTGDVGARAYTGPYWSSCSNNTSGWQIDFDTYSVHMGSADRTRGFSIRCVAYGYRNYNCFCCSFVLLAKADLRFPSKKRG